jgi:Predicted integral membrane protein
VRFYSQAPELTAVKLSVSYELPGVLAPLMDASILGGIVARELQANLDRFRDLVEARNP